jgi:hypothetical protein
MLLLSKTGSFKNSLDDLRSTKLSVSSVHSVFKIILIFLGSA